MLFHFKKDTKDNVWREKGRDLTHSYPYTNVQLQKQSGNTKKQSKGSISRRLQTDLEQSVGVTPATQLV